MSKPTLKSLAEQIAGLQGRIAELEKINDASEIIRRLDGIEKSLVKAKLLRIAGADITEGVWQPSGDSKSWTCDFDFMCPCEQIHQARIEVPYHSKDGLIYEVEGLCGRKSSMRVWQKRGAMVFSPDAGNGRPGVYGGL